MKQLCIHSRYVIESLELVSNTLFLLNLIVPVRIECSIQFCHNENILSIQYSLLQITKFIPKYVILFQNCAEIFNDLGQPLQLS